MMLGPQTRNPQFRYIWIRVQGLLPPKKNQRVQVLIGFVGIAWDIWVYLQINFPQRILETWYPGLPIAMN